MGTSKFLLQEQIKTRIKRGRVYPMIAVGMEYRSSKKPHKIRWTRPKDCAKSDIEYLRGLSEAMVRHDEVVGIDAAPC